MKKYLAIALFAVTAVLFTSFNASYDSNSGEDGEITNTEVWEHMRKNVFNELKPLVNYKEEKMFSRCPSGFAQYQDKDQTNDKMVFGTITFAQGCERDEFCLYKIDWETKTTYLKKTKKDDFVAVSTFVKTEKKVAKI